MDAGYSRMDAAHDVSEAVQVSFNENKYSVSLLIRSFHCDNVNFVHRKILIKKLKLMKNKTKTKIKTEVV